MSALLNWWAGVPGRQQMNSCLPLEDYKVRPDMHKKAVRTVFWELQHVVQKWRVPVEGAEPGEQDGARIRVVETGGQGARRVWQLTATERQKKRADVKVVRTDTTPTCWFLEAPLISIFVWWCFIYRFCLMCLTAVRIGPVRAAFE